VLKGTLPIGAMSPLAASIAIPSPLRGTSPAGPSGPPPAHGMQSAPPPAYGGSQQPPAMSSYPPNQSGGDSVKPRGLRTDPRMGTAPPASPPAKANAGALVFVVVCVVLAIVGVTFYWVRTH
jgi:hypothetical protein